MSEDNTKYSICRTCMGKSKSSFMSVNDMVKIENEVKTIIEMLQLLCNIKIDPTDELPKTVCKKCAIGVKKAYLVQQQCIRSYQTLMKLNSSERSSYIDIEIESIDGASLEDINEYISINEAADSFNQENDLQIKNSEISTDKLEIKVADNDIKIEDIPLEEIYLLENVKPELNEIDLLNKICDSDKTNHKPIDSSSSTNSLENSANKNEHEDHSTVNKTDEIMVENKYKCSHCPKLLKSKRTLRQHSHFHRNFQFLCSECGDPFHTRKKYKMHLMMIHHISPKFKCEECDKVCESKTYLEIHKSSHTGEKPFECSVCGIRVVAKSSLKSHMRLHTGEKPFKCEFCSERFRTASQRSDHTRLHTGQKFACDICNKQFDLKASYSSHKNIHKGKKHPCHLCDKAFVRKSDLTSHIRIHTGEKPYVCKICGKAFNQSNSLNTHQWVHQKLLISSKTDS